jgi:thiamine biosynthesis lipoprotein ApbE
VIGAHPAGPFWPVGVADLFQPARSWHRFELRDAAMATSGNRATHAHIVNPRDGQLITGCRTLSVACRSAVDAEVLSTALLVTPAANVRVCSRTTPKHRPWKSSMNARMVTGPEVSPGSTEAEFASITGDAAAI